VRVAPSRHDLGFAAAAAALVVLAIGARATGAGAIVAYPTFSAPVGVLELGLAGALVAVVLAPFADRRGIAR
jgi:hypothetical protein